jgi:hypothetical protein
MFNYFWIDAWHFLVRPGKNVAELFKKICIELNISGGEVSSDENILHGGRVLGDIDRYGFNDGFHITLSIKLMCS